MTSLLWRAGLRHHRRHPAQLAMVILGIALGVAGVLAMDVAIESARRSFALSVESIAGEATHEIVGGPGGVSAELYRKLRVEHGVRGIAPVVEATVVLLQPGNVSSGPTGAQPTTPSAARRTFQMIGIDPYAEAGFREWSGSGARGENGDSGGRWVGPLVTTPGGVLLGRSTAEALELAVGDRFLLESEGRQIEAELLAVLTASTELDERRLSRVVVSDVATAQELLGTTGLTRIDVREGATPQGLSIEKLSALLPDSVALRRSTLRRAALDDMTGAFQLNLRSLSLLAVLVGVFLVHSTMTFSVIQRKTLFGRLRAYGAHRGELMRTILGEALAIGLIATALGLALGIAMGHGLVDVVAASITDLYFALEVKSVTVPPFSLVKAIGIGVFATLIAAAFPAWDAANSSPRRALSRVAQEEMAHRRAPKHAAIGVFSALAGVALLAVPTKSIVVAYVGMLAVALGGAATVGWWVIRFGEFTGWVGRRFGLLYRMATRGIGAHLSRTGVATAALAIAISMVIGVGVMIASFRGTVVTWLESTLRADV
ncbi:MAG: FtsX-like permease family protein, partial [Planctomycetota bacterium]